MKNNFITKIIGATLAFAMMIGGAVGINAGKQAKEVNADSPATLTFTAACGGSGTDSDGNTWTVTSDAAESTFDNTKGIHYGTGKVSVSYLNLTTSSIAGTISEIVVNASGASSTSAKLDVTVGGSAFGEQKSLTSSANNYTLYGSASGQIVVALTQTKTTKALYCKSISVSYVTGGNVENHTITYAVGEHGVYNGSATKAFSVAENGTHTVLDPSNVGISGNTGYFFDEWNDGTNPYQVGATYTMGTSDVTLTAQWVAGIALSYNGNGAASGSTATTYVRSGETQTVAENGFEAPAGKEFKEWNTLSTGLGTSYNPGDEIENYTSSLTLYAIWQNTTRVIFDATTDTGETSITKSDITLSLSAGTLNNNSEYRFNKSSKLTISRASGKIGSIVFTCTANGTSQYGPGCFTVDGGEYSYSGKVGTWEGAANSVTFTASTNQVRATKVVVNYYQGSDVTLSTTALTLIVNGSSSSISVSEISGVTNPEYTWARASGDDCVTLTNTNSDTVTIAPKGTSFAACGLTLTVSGDNLQSPLVREATVFVARSSSENAYNVVEAKHAIDLGDSLYTDNARVAGIVSTITKLESDNSITYWISDDGTTTNELEAYKGKGLNGEVFNAVEEIDLGAHVVIEGDLSKYGQIYQLNAGNQMESYSFTAEEKIAKLDSHASLSYKYTKTGNGVLDTLTGATTGVTGTSYTTWSGKTGTSGAVYAGNSAGSYSSIQLRSSNSDSGVITTTSGGNATKVAVVWNSNTANDRTINIYGKNTAYAAASDLYGNNKGDLLGTIVHGTSTELEISGDYQYVGICSESGALYLDQIDIQWGEPVDYTYSNVAIRFGGSITPELWDELDTNEHNIAGFGVAYKKAGTFEGLLKNNISNAETADGQGFYKLVSEKAEGHPDLVNGKYLWNFYLRIPTIINEIYDEQYFDDNITAVAYIKLNNGEVVFLKETTASIKSLAQALIDDDANDYDEDSFEGSLKHLADYTGE